MNLMVENLTIVPKDHSRPIVNGVSFKVEEKSIHALVGPNGSGKSSIAYAIMGLKDYKPAKGRILFNGEDIALLSVTERARRGITLA